MYLGDYVSSDSSRATAPTERSTTSTSFVTKKTFTVDRPGTVKLNCFVRRPIGTVTQYPQVKFTKIGSQEYLANITTTTSQWHYDDINIAANDVLDIDIKAGTGSGGNTAYVSTAYISCDSDVDVIGGTVDLD